MVSNDKSNCSLLQGHSGIYTTVLIYLGRKVLWFFFQVEFMKLFQSPLSRSVTFLNELNVLEKIGQHTDKSESL